MYTKVKIGPPFKLPILTEDSCRLAYLLDHAMSQVDELPDFSEDSQIAVISDFGGEHKKALFSTYSFLIVAYNKRGPFITAIEDLRTKYGIFHPYSEFSFKDLKYGPRSRALKEFLDITDTLLHGVVLTVAISNSISTVFGPTKSQVIPRFKEDFIKLGLGEWKFAVAEKLLRVCHILSYFLAVMTNENQRLLWYCDNDAINETTNLRDFSHTQKVLNHVLGLYMKSPPQSLGFGKSFPVKSHLDDLQFICDLKAGIVQDLMTAQALGEDNIPGGREKVELLKWLVNQSKHLTKLTLQICPMEFGEPGSGVMHFSPAS